jgi:hypothetical protein
VTQPATVTRAATAAAQASARPNDGIAMEWVILESLLALVIGVGIVWWTMRPSKHRRDPPADDR